MPIYSIYRITNTITGQCYIGLTKSINARISQHKSKAKKGEGTAFHESIRTFGWEAFHCIILAQTKNLDDACYLESHLITEHNTFNLQSGGMYGFTLNQASKDSISTKLKGYTLSEETKAKMKGRTPWNKGKKGKPLSPEHKAKLIESNKNRVHKPHTDEAKAKIKAKRALQKMTFKQLECPHCGKVGASNVMNRWHFDNCKIKQP
jgi:group I intron endonuclease